MLLVLIASSTSRDVWILKVFAYDAFCSGHGIRIRHHGARYILNAADAAVRRIHQLSYTVKSFWEMLPFWSLTTAAKSICLKNRIDKFPVRSA